MKKIQKSYEYVGPSGEIHRSKWFFVRIIGDEWQLKNRLRNYYRTVKVNK